MPWFSAFIFLRLKECDASPRKKASPRSRCRQERRRRLGKGVAKKEGIAQVKASPRWRQAPLRNYDEGKAHNMRNVCRVKRRCKNQVWYRKVDVTNNVRYNGSSANRANITTHANHKRATFQWSSESALEEDEALIPARRARVSRVLLYWFIFEPAPREINVSETPWSKKCTVRKQ